jgi:hypothetical protein
MDNSRSGPALLDSPFRTAPPEGYQIFRLVVDDPQLVPGRKIIWRSAGGKLVEGTVAKVRRNWCLALEDGCEIYFEFVKYFQA